MLPEKPKYRTATQLDISFEKDDDRKTLALKFNSSDDMNAVYYDLYPIFKRAGKLHWKEKKQEIKLDPGLSYAFCNRPGAKPRGKDGHVAKMRTVGFDHSKRSEATSFRPASSHDTVNEVVGGNVAYSPPEAECRDGPSSSKLKNDEKESVMKDVQALSDVELSNELKSLGASIGPVTGTTRTLYEKKLLKMRATGAKPVEKTNAAEVPASEKRKSVGRPKKPTSSSHTGNTTRRTTTSESEDGSDNDIEIISPPSATKKSTRAAPKPVSSTPTKPSRPSPSPEKEDVLNSSRRSLNTSYKPTNAIIPGLRTVTAPKPSETIRSTPRQDKSPVRPRAVGPLGGDRPGLTPPRSIKSSASRTPPRTTKSVLSTTYTSASPSSNPNMSADRSYFSSSSRVSRNILDLGNTTGEESDGDQEESRIVYSNKGNDQRGAARKVWDTVLGNDFKVGKEPGTSYQMRHGALETRVDRNKGKLTVKQRVVGRDSSQIIMYIFLVFFVLLAAAYIRTAHNDKVAATWKVISDSVRDTVAFFYTYTILPIIVVAVVGVVTAIGYFGHKKYMENQAKEKELFEELVENIIDEVRASAEDNREYISIPHTRDRMLPATKRSGNDLKRWELAVEFINNNESRIATETRIIRGQECSIWRWLPANKTGWQGSAFASYSSQSTSGTRPTTSSTVNATDKQGRPVIEALTKSLKIRNFCEDRAGKSSKDPIDYEGLKKAIKTKTFPIVPVHIGFPKHGEIEQEVVFAQFSNRMDARSALLNLHGSWFNGNLVSVKYMRDSRYSERFAHDLDYN